MAIADESVRETRFGEDRESACAMKASQSVRDSGKRRTERRWSCVMCAGMEWSESDFFDSVSAGVA